MAGRQLQKKNVRVACSKNYTGKDQTIDVKCGKKKRKAKPQKAIAPSEQRHVQKPEHITMLK